ncbi:STAS domain-containing protein [Blastococcus sp. TF02-09]|uniref:STAS domain-containing protein n=1 Tax=Blastococcus sp. TF02-09 TaxID=2250576 RepID=UPI001F39E4AA|nr:STAS domain-containing protein [Blastococcus sp. TF02-9]
MSGCLPIVELIPFTVRLDLAGGRLEVDGRLDYRTAHLVHDAISALVHTHNERWVIDVSRSAGSDTACLRLLGVAYRRAVRHGRQITLIGASPSLQQALSRLRLNHHLTSSEVS